MKTEDALQSIGLKIINHKAGNGLGAKMIVTFSTDTLIFKATLHMQANGEKKWRETYGTGLSVDSAIDALARQL